MITLFILNKCLQLFITEPPHLNWSSAMFRKRRTEMIDRHYSKHSPLLNAEVHSGRKR